MTWGLTGLFGLDSNPFLECTTSGLKWEKVTMFGDIFPTLHVAAVIMHATLVVIIFYRFPKKIFYPESKGIFIKNPDTCLVSTDTDEEASSRPSSPHKYINDSTRDRIERFLHIK